MKKRTVNEIDIAGKRVFVRVDFNVPLTEDGEIRDDTRIVAALPTLEKILAGGGKLIVASHLGRPKGNAMPEFSLAPCARRLSELLGRKVAMAPDCIGPECEALVAAMAPGDVLMLENLRFHIGEEKNHGDFAEQLAKLCDVVVNDAFGTAHRAHASNVGIAQRVAGGCVAGLLLAAEIDGFNRAMANPERPVVAILGGSKVSTKIQVIETLLEKVDRILIGGGMAFTFLRAQGATTGASLVEEEMLDVALRALAKAKEKGIQILLPQDAVVAENMDASAHTRIVSSQHIGDGLMGLDIGPGSVRAFAAALEDAKTIIWNGPPGVFEVEPFASGSLALAQAVAASGAFTVIGGGDTIACVSKAQVADRISHISTGGGAFLELLEGKALPGIEAIDAA